MRNRGYWERRLTQLEEAQLQRGQKFYNELENEYRTALANIERDISRWYTRFADNNQISLVEAKRLLNSDELEEFKWDVKQYIKYGEANALNQQWMKELENASARVHISRLESLKIQLQHQAEVIYGNQLDGLDKLARSIYSEGYYHTAYEIQRGFNIGWDLHPLNDRQITSVLAKPWTTDGRTFKDRAWTNKNQLVGSVHTELTQALVRGDSPNQAIRNIANEFNVDRHKAGRLIMTESAFFASAAQKDCFNDLDVEQFEIVSTLDGKTSEICQDLDGKVFRMSEYEIGVTAPPFHPWCRTVTVPYFDDNFGERAARDNEGNTYYVPSDMKYEDWKKSFVNGGSKVGLQEELADFERIYKEWDGVNIESFATNIVNKEGLPFQVQRHKLGGVNGQCRLRYANPHMEILSFELNSDDARSASYQVKTAFHELFHAKAHGLVHDIGDLSLSDWAYVDDVFAEVTAHYMTKSVGVADEIVPAYASHLVNSLPKLKKLPEFNSCETIADFGKVAYKYRFSNNGTAQWKDIFDVLNDSDLDIIEYSKSYLHYIEEHKAELVDKLLENMPKYSQYRHNMIDDVEGAIKTVRNGWNLHGNEKMVFENALIITMNRLGVK